MLCIYCRCMLLFPNYLVYFVANFLPFFSEFLFNNFSLFFLALRLRIRKTNYYYFFYTHIDDERISKNCFCFGYFFFFIHLDTHVYIYIYTYMYVNIIPKYNVCNFPMYNLKLIYRFMTLHRK